MLTLMWMYCNVTIWQIKQWVDIVVIIIDIQSSWSLFLIIISGRDQKKTILSQRWYRLTIECINISITAWQLRQVTQSISTAMHAQNMMIMTHKCHLITYKVFFCICFHYYVQEMNIIPRVQISKVKHLVSIALENDVASNSWQTITQTTVGPYLQCHMA